MVIFTWKMWNVLKRKNQFSDFNYWDIVNFVLKIGKFSMTFKRKIDHYSKNINRKIDFSFVTAHCASFMKMGAILRGEGLYILSWEDPIHVLENDKQIHRWTNPPLSPLLSPKVSNKNLSQEDAQCSETQSHTNNFLILLNFFVQKSLPLNFWYLKM